MPYYIKQIKTWLVILAFCVPILFFGNYFAERNGIVVSLIISLFLMFFALYYHPKNPMEAFYAQRHEGRDPWDLISRALEFSNQIQLPPPQIYIIPNSSPFVMVVGPALFSPAIAFSDGVLHKMSVKEREALLILALTTLKKRSSVQSIFFERCALTLLSMLQFLSTIKILNILITPIFQTLICLFFKLAHPISSQLSADQNAKKFIPKAQILAQALWKTNGALSNQKLNFEPDCESYFLILPHAASRSLFRLQPNIEKRLKNLVGYFPI